jgi:group I intron endonuclease
MIGIYKITAPTGKVYIGQSKNIEKRFQNHKAAYNLKKNTKLYNSFKKYGVENHLFEVVEECKVEQLDYLEELYGYKYKVLEEGLNHRLGDGKWQNRTLTETHKAHIKQSTVGRKWSEETIKKRKESMKGKNTQQVRCTTDGMLFNSIQAATDYYNLKWRKYIEDVCSGRAKQIKGLHFEKIPN